VPQALSKTADGEFAGAVGGLSRRTDESEDARDIYDVALFLFAQDGQENGRAIHRAPEIDVHQPLHVFERDILEITDQSDAGIIDQMCDSAVFTDSYAGHRLELIEF
jgi:hypothetical protein